MCIHIKIENMYTKFWKKRRAEIQTMLKKLKAEMSAFIKVRTFIASYNQETEVMNLLDSCLQNNVS